MMIASVVPLGVLVQPERGGDGLGHERRVDQARQLDQPHPVDGRQRRGLAVSSARRVLPLPPAPVSVTSRAWSSRSDTLGHLVLATHEARERSGQRRGTVRRGGDGLFLGVERRVLDEDRLLEPLERDAGLEPELLAQVVGRPPVGPQRLALAPDAVEREHQLAPEPLAQRMLGDERLRARPTTSPARPSARSASMPLLERSQPQLVEPRGLDRRERFVGEVGERRPAPEGQCLAQEGGRVRGVVVQSSVRPAHELLETASVDRGRGRRRARSRAGGSRWWRPFARAPCGDARRRPGAS